MRPRARLDRGSLLAVCCLLLFFLEVGLSDASPGQDVLRLQLKVKDEVRVSGASADMFLYPVRCDGRGSVYLRIATQPDLFQSPVTKISREGSVQAVFSFTAVPGFEKSQLVDYAVGLRGDLYGLVVKPVGRGVERDILSFSDDGGFRFATKLEPVFTPSHLAVFPTGDFLVYGWKEIKDGAPVAGKTPPDAAPPPAATETGRRQPPPVEPFVALLDRTGRVLKEIALSGREDSKGAGGSAGAKGIPSSEISLGEVLAGDDGNIYLMMRKGSGPWIYVVSAAGEILRSFDVRPPGQNYEEMSMGCSAGGKLVFEFERKLDDRRTDWKNAIFSIVDGETGSRELDYESSAGIGGGMACYSPNDGFTVLRNLADGQLVLSRAGP